MIFQSTNQNLFSSLGQDIDFYNYIPTSTKEHTKFSNFLIALVINGPIDIEPLHIKQRLRCGPEKAIKLLATTVTSVGM